LEIIQFSAIFHEVKTVRRSFRFVFETNEDDKTAEEVAKSLALRGEFVQIAIGIDKTTIDPDKLNRPDISNLKKKGKSSESKLLYNKIWALWNKNNGGIADFEEFYGQQMEAIRNYVQIKINKL